MGIEEQIEDRGHAGQRRGQLANSASECPALGRAERTASRPALVLNLSKFTDSLSEMGCRRK